MKYIQVFGNLIPILLVVFGYYLFNDIEPDTPSYAGASLVMLWFGVSVLAVCFVFLFILPSSFILLKEENRSYFGFKSRRWLSVLIINWFFIALYGLCVLVYILTI